MKLVHHNSDYFIFKFDEKSNEVNFYERVEEFVKEYTTFYYIVHQQGIFSNVEIVVRILDPHIVTLFKLMT